MKKILAALLVLVLITSAAYAYPSDAFLNAVSNATFLITEFNSAGMGLKSDGVYDFAELNTVAISFTVEDFTFSQFREVKRLDAELYAELTASFKSLSNEFIAVCDSDLYEKIHVVFSVMSNDGVGLYLTIDGIDMTWMISDY